MSTRLTNAPVCFTLAQMRFNPVVMEPILPDLQEAFRRAGFPDYFLTEGRALEVSASDSGMEVREQIVKRLVYRNKKKTAAIILDSASLTYELSAYSVFKDFLDAFLQALEIVHRHRAIEYWDRLGMRMLDAVQPVQGETLEQYLAPQALGFIGLGGDSLKFQQALTESVFNDEGRTLVVRTLRVPLGIAFPPDLAPLRLPLDERFVGHQGPSAMLDCDSSILRRADFSPEDVKAEMAKLKSALSLSFKALVTPYSLQVWA